MNITRAGFGYDIHRLAEGHSLILGGIEIPEATRGTVAHSDGDVLLHAICDALLGAVGLADIGTYFPDTDDEWEGACSVDLLGRVCSLVRSEQAEIISVDATIVLERPKLAAYKGQMAAKIAETIALPPRRIGVKATTNEQLGPVGSGDGIAAFAVATVVVNE